MEHRRASELLGSVVVSLAGIKYRRAGDLGLGGVVLTGMEHDQAAGWIRTSLVALAGQLADGAGVAGRPHDRQAIRGRCAPMGGGGVIMAPLRFMGQVGTFLRHAQWYKEEERMWRGRAVMERSLDSYTAMATRGSTRECRHTGKGLHSRNIIF